MDIGETAVRRETIYRTVIPAQAGIQGLFDLTYFKLLTLDAGLHRHDRVDLFEQKKKPSANELPQGFYDFNKMTF